MAASSRKVTKYRAHPSASSKRRDDAFYESLAAPLSQGPAMPVMPYPTAEAVAAARLSAWDAWRLTRAALIDLWAIIKAILHFFFNARTFALALALMAIGAMAATIWATVMAQKTFFQYRNMITSPAVILANKKTGTTILDRNGVVLYQTEGATTGGLTPLEELPRDFRDATIAAEDPHFYDHPGISWEAMARAAYVDATQRGAVEGGSTLTQQLVKNAVLTPTKTIERKFQEIVLAIELEKRYSKDQILQMYVSEVPYGQSAYGVETAAKTYFGKTPMQLTLGQSALLAGLPLGPSRFDPVVNPEAARDRRNFVLNRMFENGMITEAERATAMAEPVVASPRQVEIKAPHFVFYVLNELRARYGDEVETGGLTVTTTLDITKQAAGEEIVRAQIQKLAPNNVTNGGLVSLHPLTGDILSMVGSVGYSQPQFGAVNVTTSLLQPGSSFKPLAYVTAFAQGWNGATVVDDKPLSLPDGSNKVYKPQNYDGKFRGPVTLRRALGNSLNIPAIEVLRKTGLPATIKTATDLGITTLNEPNRYGLSLVLGGAEVKPIEMAAAYGGFATGGRKVTPRAILKVQGRMDNVIEAAPAVPSQPAVIDARHAYMITSILSDNAARTEVFGPNSALNMARPAAVKTGTTNDFRDNWTVGYTPGVVTAVWVGNNNHTPMNGVSGATGAAPIWRTYMDRIHAGAPVETFPVPAGITIAKVGRNGCITPAGMTGGTDEVFLSNAVPTTRCAMPTPRPTTQPEPDQNGGATPTDEDERNRGENGNGNRGRSGEQRD